MKAKVVYGTKKNQYFIDGKRVSKKKFDRVCKSKFSGGAPNTLMETSKAWPRMSDSVGCDPKQKQEFEEMTRKLGVPTEIDKKTGCAIFRNNAHQRSFLKATGNHNRHGGYGEITG